MTCNILLVLCIFAISSCYGAALILSLSDSSSHEESLYIKHEKWMSQHGRYYENEEEKVKRFKIFKDNVEYIERLNRQGNGTYKVAINKFADLTNEEFVAKYGGNLHVSSSQHDIDEPYFQYQNLENLPASLDWRDHNAVTPIQNQGHCGACWAFTAVAAIEGIIAIRSGKLTPLSEQHLLDCNYAQEGCNGGRFEHAFDFVSKNGGLASDDDYPYKSTQGSCNRDIKPSSLSHMNINGYGFVPSNNEAALLAAVAKQPVSVAIDPGLLQFYESGVLRGECGTKLTHAVTAIGYGTSEDGIKYWLFRNSWGGDWGEEGYFKLERGVDAVEGMCGIAAYASYPTA